VKEKFSNDQKTHAQRKRTENQNNLIKFNQVHPRKQTVSWSSTSLFQHKYGYIRDERSGAESYRAIPTQ